LETGGIVGQELAEDLTDPSVITAIEWAGIVDGQLPADRLRITIETTGDTQRRLTFSSGGPVSAALVTALKEAA
jgi:tRNA A37 threonylcarbamoyladenosine biosynthesis protein TsaE